MDSGGFLSFNKRQMRYRKKDVSTVVDTLVIDDGGTIVPRALLPLVGNVDKIYQHCNSQKECWHSVPTLLALSANIQ